MCNDNLARLHVNRDRFAVVPVRNIRWGRQVPILHSDEMDGRTPLGGNLYLPAPVGQTQIERVRETGRIGDRETRFHIYQPNRHLGAVFDRSESSQARVIILRCSFETDDGGVKTWNG